MSIADESALKTMVQNLMGATSSKVSDDGFSQAITNALSELQWSLPLTNSSECYWLIERTKRHVLYILLTESAYKFQYKKIFLHYRFNNYFKLIEKMDKDFLTALDREPTLFDTGTYGFIGDYLTAGFDYTELGVDSTYGSDWT